MTPYTERVRRLMHVVSLLTNNPTLSTEAVDLANTLARAKRPCSWVRIACYEADVLLERVRAAIVSELE